MSTQDCYTRYKVVKGQAAQLREYCQDCGMLLLPGETTSHQGQGHTVVTGVKNRQLKHPTQLFSPLDDNKTFAVSTLDSYNCNYEEF